MRNKGTSADCSEWRVHALVKSPRKFWLLFGSALKKRVDAVSKEGRTRSFMVLPAMRSIVRNARAHHFDKDDCVDMVVAMCRTETMTGQTVVIDFGRIFH